MNYNEKKAELESKFNAASAAIRLEAWAAENKESKPAKKEKKVEKEANEE